MYIGRVSSPLNLRTGGACPTGSDRPAEALPRRIHHFGLVWVFNFCYWGILFACFCFVLFVVCFSFLFCPNIFLYSPPLDIDQLKLILRLVGTPGAELLKKISSESVS